MRTGVLKGVPEGIPPPPGQMRLGSSPCHFICRMAERLSADRRAKPLGTDEFGRRNVGILEKEGLRFSRRFVRNGLELPHVSAEKGSRQKCMFRCETFDFRCVLEALWEIWRALPICNATSSCAIKSRPCSLTVSRRGR